LFKGTNEIEIINQIRDGLVPPPSTYNKDCPTDLDDIVLKALERDKEERWSSAGEMRDALDDLRRFHRGDTSADTVAAWVDELRGETVRGQRIESESENTVMHLSEEDVYDLDGSSVPGGEGDELAIGSQRGAPPVYAKGSDIQTFDDTMDEDTADSAPKFKDVDTIVSQYTPRKS
jgi:serine/threonine-protein kinase